MEREIEIMAGGTKVPLNEFARKIVLNTIIALVGSLRDVDSGAEIRITVRKRPTAAA